MPEVDGNHIIRNDTVTVKVIVLLYVDKFEMWHYDSMPMCHGKHGEAIKKLGITFLNTL